jgi:hypothetical protein
VLPRSGRVLVVVIVAVVVLMDVDIVILALVCIRVLTAVVDSFPRISDLMGPTQVAPSTPNFLLVLSLTNYLFKLLDNFFLLPP